MDRLNYSIDSFNLIIVITFDTISRRVKSKKNKAFLSSIIDKIDINENKHVQSLLSLKS